MNSVTTSESAALAAGSAATPIPDEQTPQAADNSAPKTVLAVGSRKELSEFFTFYLCHVLHGENLQVFYPDEPLETQVAPREGIYERAYLFNVTPDLVRSTNAQLVLSLNTRPQPYIAVTAPPPSLEGDNCFIMAQRADEFHVTPMMKEIKRVVTYRHTEADPKKGDHPCSTALTTTLFYLAHGAWPPYGAAVSAYMGALPMMGFQVRGELEHNLRAAVLVLQGLPEFASLEAALFYNDLTKLERTFEAFDVFMNTPRPQPLR